MQDKGRERLRLVDLSAAAPEEAIDRCSRFAVFLQRLNDAEGRPVDGANAGGEDEALEILSRAGRLSFSADPPWEVRYDPSHEALTAVLDGSAGGWPERLRKRQQQALKAAPGAIFRCPAEDGEAHLELFITDWSPCPGACALAIHRHHPFARDTRRPDPSHFTGRYARHPLTGDLIPVWVADWVKPEFGTGVVLVNPAHDRTDMEFARRVGLPIRFALVPDEFDGTPATWPTPPVIKTGRTIKTGKYDGLSPAEAVHSYLRALIDVGLGQRHTDYQLEYRELGSLVPDESGRLRFCLVCGLVEAAGGVASCPACGHERSRVRLAHGWLLAQVSAVRAADGLVSVVCPARAVESALVLVPLLLTDLGGEVAFDSVHVVQRCELARASGEEATLAAAALVSAKPGDVGVVRQQLVDQVDRFLAQHQRVVETAGPVDTTLDGVPGSIRNVVQAIRQMDLGRAFSQLYTVQKQLVQGSTRPPAVELGYLVSSSVLLGLPMPAGRRASDVWSQLIG